MRNSDKELKARGAALVTGASRGLGFELAKCFSDRGFDVVLTGTDKQALLSAAERMTTKAYVYVADLSLDGEARRLYYDIKRDGISISVLVNNAGLGASGEGWTVSDKRDDDIINVNIRSAVILSKLFLKDACEGGFGALCNVCSVGAFQPGPYTASYYASKSFLHSYTLALRYEARKYGVNVTSFCPGPLDTGFFERANAKKPRSAMSAQKAARRLMSGFLKNKKTVVPGLYNRAARLLPAALKSAYVAKIKK